MKDGIGSPVKSSLVFGVGCSVELEMLRVRRPSVRERQALVRPYAIICCEFNTALTFLPGRIGDRKPVGWRRGTDTRSAGDFQYSSCIFYLVVSVEKSSTRVVVFVAGRLVSVEEIAEHL